MNDFVFREHDGGLALVGDFDGLYQAESDPWQQGARCGAMAAYYAYSRCRVGHALRLLLPVTFEAGRCIEVGCGHGHALAYFAGICGGDWLGFDISPTAIAGARERFPAHRFEVIDIRRLYGANRVGADVVLLNQMLWYVLEDIDAVIANCIAMVKPGGLVAVSQAFLTGAQRYGAGIANGFDGALAMMLRCTGLQLVHAEYDDTGRFAHNDGLMVFRRKP